MSSSHLAGAKFEIRDKDGKTAVIEQVLEINNVLTEPKLPQTGDNTNLWVWIGLGVLSVICGLGVYFRKKDEKK